MAKIDNIPFDQLFKIFHDYHKRMPTIVSASAVSFFKQSFRRQGWVYNSNLKRWEPRSPLAKRNKRRALLIDTGKLRRSIRTIYKSLEYIEVGSELPYAEIHNEGGHVKKTARVPGFVRKGHKVKAHKRKFKGKTVKVPTHQREAAQVKAHTREMDFEVPQRRFIGESPDVLIRAERDLFRYLENEINRVA